MTFATAPSQHVVPDGGIRMSRQVAVLVALAAVVVTNPLAAQRDGAAGVTRAASRGALARTAVPQGSEGGHSGFHAAVGLGAGSVGVSCDDCEDDREEGGVLMLRFGGALRPGLVLSGEVTGWNRREESDGGTTLDANANWFLVSWQFYPDPAKGLFWKLGAGVSSIDVTVDPPGAGNARLRASSLGLSIGGGYDIRIARGFGLTPYIDLMMGADSEAKVNGNETGEKLGANLIYLGLAASWR
jgi:hypothetical protein